MKAFVLRVVVKEARYDKDVPELCCFVPFYSLCCSSKLGHEKEFRNAPGVVDGAGRIAALTEDGYQIALTEAGYQVADAGALGGASLLSV